MSSQWTMTPRFALLATILILASGCDKAKLLAAGGKDDAEPPPEQQLDLAGRPDILFQVFGEREDPRIIPVAALEGGRLERIVLSTDNWRRFDEMYTRSGQSYPLYRDGVQRGTLAVSRGMWEREEPLYSLPGCKRLTPVAAVTLQDAGELGYSVEMFASTASLGMAHPGPTLTGDQTRTIARGIARAAADSAGIGAERFDALDARYAAVRTGVGREPTVIGTFISPDAEGGEGAQVAHAFIIADATDGETYQSSYTHTVNGPASTAEFQRYLDHLDLDGDSIDELFLEAWRSGGDTFLVVLGYQGGVWRERYRTRSNWCLDARPGEDAAAGR